MALEEIPEMAALMTGAQTVNVQIGEWPMIGQFLSGGLHEEGGVGLFVPATPNAAVQADLDTLKADKQALHDDIAALSTADKTTLQTDIRVDQRAIRTDTKNGTDPTADQAKLKADQAAGPDGDHSG